MDIRFALVQAFVFFFAITVHEAAHAWTANRLGDPTAAALGRASLNPLAHIDLFGTIILPVLLYIAKQPIFGWAKPVPYNPNNLRHPRRGGLWISFAGPIANILTAAAAVLVYQVLKAVGAGVPVTSMWSKPLGGLANILFVTAVINISLAVFNLIPIPPLDGSGILAGLLSERAAVRYERLRPYGFLILIALMYTNLLNVVFAPVQKLIVRLFT
ncbi:MAG TPA: site-2 protease family protein [Candidatus Aminicenantes bacterium]|nr:site-2 protease family protein [Candidatus Aminicenantes bacterium]HRY64722.1 site-2 protease family protein [Candidatus Aminicenantes bacterium]HRZ71635.1 site-2 protease family protein [Candidatus Aminicenantes bacterium]